MSQTEKPGLPEGALVQLEQQKKVAFFWGGVVIPYLCLKRLVVFKVLLLRFWRGHNLRPPVTSESYCSSL